MLSSAVEKEFVMKLYKIKKKKRIIKDKRRFFLKPLNLNSNSNGAISLFRTLLSIVEINLARK